jgi:hypothetical protein
MLPRRGKPLHLLTIMALVATAWFGSSIATQAQTVTGSVEVVDLPLPSGGTERVLLIPARPAFATVILLAGGDGVFTIDPSGMVRPDENFLIRTRHLWVGQGFTVIVSGPPNGQSLLGQRSTPHYASALDRVVDFALSRSSAPVWVIGTSQGSTAAVNGGARLAGKVSGVVLTSSVTQRSRADETVFDSEPGAISVPVLVVVNSGDQCVATPPADAPRILASLVRSPRKELITVESHEARSDACRAMSPHGFFGIEAAVVQHISDWIKIARTR